MSTFRQSSLQEVNEIVLDTGSYSLSVPDSSYEKVESVAHGLKVQPYYDYSVSWDGGVSYVSPPVNKEAVSGLYYLYMYADKTNIYFHWVWGSPLASPPSAATYYFKYKLFLMEIS